MDRRPNPGRPSLVLVWENRQNAENKKKKNGEVCSQPEFGTVGVYSWAPKPPQQNAEKADMMPISTDLESVRTTQPGGWPRGSPAEHDARKPMFFASVFWEKHLPRLGIYRLAGFVDSNEFLTGPSRF